MRLLRAYLTAWHTRCACAIHLHPWPNQPQSINFNHSPLHLSFLTLCLLALFLSLTSVLALGGPEDAMEEQKLEGEDESLFVSVEDS